MRKPTLVIGVVGALLAFAAGMVRRSNTEGSQAADSPRTAQKATVKPGEVVGPSEEVKAEIRAIQARRFRYRGTEIKPALQATEEDLRLQKQICSAFAIQDPCPSDRRTTFDWCFSEARVNAVGWYGLIKRAWRTEDYWLVEVQVSPRLAGFGAVTFTPDYCIETWKYTSDGKLTYVRGVHPDNSKRGVLFGD